MHNREATAEQVVPRVPPEADNVSEVEKKFEELTAELIGDDKSRDIGTVEHYMRWWAKQWGKK